MTDIIFTVATEFGVKGYHAGLVTYVGTLDEVKAKLEKASVDFARKLSDAEEDDGDLRRFCPSFGNGYPMLNSLGGAEQGEDFDITILKVTGTKTVVTENEYDYHTDAYIALREAAGEEIVEGFDSRVYRLNALGAQQRRCLEEAHRRMTTFHSGNDPLLAWSGLGHKTEYKTTVADGFMRWASYLGKEPADRQQGWLILTEKGLEMLKLMGLELQQKT